MLKQIFENIIKDLNSIPVFGKENQIRMINAISVLEKLRDSTSESTREVQPEAPGKVTVTEEESHED